MSARKLVFVVVAALWSAPSLAYQCAVTANNVAFGSYDVFASAPLTTAGTLTVSCAAQNLFEFFFGFSASFQIALSGGTSGNPANRFMPGASGDALTYNIYTDPTYSVVWGDGTAGTVKQAGQITVPPFAFLGLQQFSTYGRIPAGQNVSAGAYQDTIVVSVNY